MIELKLTETEAQKLDGALERRVADMMKELVHTTDRAAHAELRASYEELENLQKRLRSLIS